MRHAKPSVTHIVTTRAHISQYLGSMHVACGGDIAHLPCVKSSPLILVINGSACVCEMVRCLSHEEHRVERLLISVSSFGLGFPVELGRKRSCRRDSAA